MGYKEQFSQAKKDKKGKSLSAKYVEWKDKGQVIVGRLLSKNEVSGQIGGRPYNQYLFETDDGLIKFALGTATDGEAGALMVIGGVYAVTFEGQENLTGGRKINRFNVLELESPQGSQVGGGSDVPF